MKKDDIVAMRAKLEKATDLSGKIDQLMATRSNLSNAKTLLIQSNYNGVVHVVHHSTDLVDSETEKSLNMFKIDYRILDKERIKEVMKKAKEGLLEVYDNAITDLRTELEAL